MTEINGIQIELRDPQPGDINFLLSTMLKGLYYGSKFWGLVDQDSFFTNYEPYLKTAMINNNISIACLADDPDIILGYSVYKGSNLQFIFVKKSYRKLGVGKLLYPSGIETVSHLTDIGNSIRLKLGLKFNPFITGA